MEVRTRLDTTEDSDEDMDVQMDEREMSSTSNESVVIVNSR